MKKSLIISFMTFSLFLNGGDASAYMGIILNKTLPGACTLIRDSTTLTCQASTRLFLGDRIQLGFSLEKLDLYLLPHARLVEEELGLYRVGKAQQDVNQGWLKALIEDHFGKQNYYAATTAVRGNSETTIESFVQNIKVTPPSNATVLLDLPINFRWRAGEGEILIIENMAGETVFSHSLPNSDYYDLTPEKAGLQSGQMYRWYYQGDILEDRYTLKILDINDPVVASFKKELEKLPPLDSVDNAIYVASFLQVISDLNESIDFYWLSYQILPHDSAKLDDTQKTKILNLISRYYERTK